MEQLSTLIQYAEQHPIAVAGTAIAVAAVYYLLKRKSKMTREAEAVIDKMRKERGDCYNKTRPLR